MNNQDIKVPSNLVVTALLSSGITTIVSISYIVLSILALIYRFNCEAADPSTTNATEYFWNTVYRVYILSDDCQYHITSAGLTQSYTVFIFVLITLCFSAVTLITGIALAALINNKDTIQYINVYVYAYIGTYVGSLVVDLTFGTHLGMDFTYLTDQLASNSQYDHVVDIVRQGALYLLAISLKGYVVHAVNIVLIILMIVFLIDFQDTSKQDEHSIHKVGTINAFDQPRRHDESWARPEIYAGPYPKRSREQLNNAFIDDEPRRSDYYNNPRTPGSFRRSDSWHHQHSSPQSHQMPSSSSSRPFSYLEEVRRPVPVKPPASPAVEGWRGAWSGPPVPAPDYSPHSPRRLKSALKPNYM